MNFSYGIIAVVGVLVAISIGFIVQSPDDIIEPRAMVQGGAEMVSPMAEPVETAPEPEPMMETEEEPMMELADEPESEPVMETEEEPVEVAPEPVMVPEPVMETAPEPEVVCTAEWDPMCGADGMTYGNMCELNAAGIDLDHKGECAADMPVSDAETESEDVPKSEPKDMQEMQSDATSLTVSLPDGTGVPGCETSNECYLPYDATIPVGATVVWSNDDIAAHTVTSGTVTTGATGVFDSGLFMADTTFEFTFETKGTFDYFCMVHPWMTGVIRVE